MHPIASMLALSGCVLRRYRSDDRTAFDQISPVAILRDCSKPSAALVHGPDMALRISGKASRAIDIGTWEYLPDTVWTMRVFSTGAFTLRSSRKLTEGELIEWNEFTDDWIWPTLPTATVRRFIEEYT